MGVLDKPLRGVAKKVIRKLGTPVTLIQVRSGAYNTTTGGGTPTKANAEVWGAYSEYRTKELGDHIALGDRQLTVAASALTWVPTAEDRVKDGDVTYRIVDVRSPQATDQAAVHILQLRGGP